MIDLILKLTSLALSLTWPSSSCVCNNQKSFPFRRHPKFTILHYAQLCVSIRSERGIIIYFPPNICQARYSNCLIKASYVLSSDGYYLHFTHVETEAHSSQTICPKSDNWETELYE